MIWAIGRVQPNTGWLPAEILDAAAEPERVGVAGREIGEEVLDEVALLEALDQPDLLDAHGDLRGDRGRQLAVVGVADHAAPDVGLLRRCGRLRVALTPRLGLL